MVRQAHHERVSISMSPLFRFFALTYVVSWTCFLAAAAVQRMVSTGGELPVFATALLLVGTVAPALVALAMTASSSESDGVRALVDRLFQWQVGARWFAFAVGYAVGEWSYLAILAALARPSRVSFDPVFREPESR